MNNQSSSGGGGSPNQDFKLADYFAVIGLDEDLAPFDGITEDLMVERVEIIYKADPDIVVPYNKTAEKWIDLDGANTIFLRLIYGTEKPITDINFYRIKHQKDQPRKMQIPVSVSIEPVPIRIYGDPDADKKFRKTRKINQEDKKKDMNCYYGEFDLTPYLEEGQQQQGSNLCFCYTRKKKNLPISDIEIVQGVPISKPASASGQIGDDLEINLPQNMKQVNYRLGRGGMKNRLLCFKQRNFLKRSFQPKVLDRYPPPPQDRVYYPFPGDSLSQFCFPTGIQFTSERTVPTHFSFILTLASGQHVYGTALLFDETLPPQMKNAIKQKGHLLNVEGIFTQKAICVLSHYSMMDSFKEVLKQIYRIHLSHTPIPLERFIVNLMEEIPVPDKAGQIQVLHEIGNQSIPFYRAVDQYPPFASRRDVEYLFRALNAEQVIDIFLALLLEKKVLLISKYKALLTHAAIALISFLFPLAWKHVLIPILPKSMIDVLDAPVTFLIGLEKSILKEGEQQQQNQSQQNLNSSTSGMNSSFEIPNEVFRVDLDMGFISLREQRPKVPQREYKQLKERLVKATRGIERPSPQLEEVELAFNVVSYDEGDDDPDQYDEDGNYIGAKQRFNEYEIRDAFLEFMTSIMSGYTKCLNTPDSSKEVFLDARDFFDFEKFRQLKDARQPNTLIYRVTETTLFAHFIEARSFGRSEFDEQIMFFDEICKQKRSKKQPQLVGPFKEQKTVKTMAPTEEGLEIDPLTRQQKIFKYETFPKFDVTQFYIPRKIECYNNEDRGGAGMHLKSLINNEQLSKMHDSEWARYLAEIIYILWFQIFTTTLPMYPQYSRELIGFCKSMLAHINRKLHPMRDIEIIYRRLFEACGTCRLQEEILELFNDMKRNKIEPDKVTFGTYYQAFQVAKKPLVPATPTANPFNSSQMGGSDPALLIPGVPMKESYLKQNDEDIQKKLNEIHYRMTEEEKTRFGSQHQQQNHLSIGRYSSGSITGAATESEFGGGDFIETQVESSRGSLVKLSQILDNSLYLEIETICQQCEKPLKEEEILSSFSKNLSAYAIRCPLCKENDVPKFKVYSEHRTDYLKGKDGIRIQLLSPVTLYKEYVNIVEQKGEQIVLKETFLREHTTVFWNIILYFKVMRLPIFMLDLDYSQQRIKSHVSMINRFLPLDKHASGRGNIIGLAMIPKQPTSGKGEQSPARKSSIGRLTSSMIDAVLGNSSAKNKAGPSSKTGGTGFENQNQKSLSRADSGHGFDGSEKGGAGDRDSVKNEQVQHAEKKSNAGSFFGRRPPSSHKSNNSGGGKGPGSVITSLSDLERIEKIMTQAQHANKSIVKFFSKHLDEFRREQNKQKEIILSDLIQYTQAAIPEAMNKHIQGQVGTQKQQNPINKNLMEWTKNTQQITADNIIKNEGSKPHTTSNPSDNRHSIPSSSHGSNTNMPDPFSPPPHQIPKIGVQGKQSSTGASIMSNFINAIGFGSAARGDSASRKSESSSKGGGAGMSSNNTSQNMINKPPRDIPQSGRQPVHGHGLGSLMSPQKQVIGMTNPTAIQPQQPVPPPKLHDMSATGKKQ